MSAQSPMARPAAQPRTARHEMLRHVALILAVPALYLVIVQSLMELRIGWVREVPRASAIPGGFWTLIVAVVLICTVWRRGHVYWSLLTGFLLEKTLLAIVLVATGLMPDAVTGVLGTGAEWAVRLLLPGFFLLTTYLLFRSSEAFQVTPERRWGTLLREGSWLVAITLLLDAADLAFVLTNL